MNVIWKSLVEEPYKDFAMRKVMATREANLRKTQIFQLLLVVDPLKSDLAFLVDNEDCLYHDLKLGSISVRVLRPVDAV